MRYWINQFSKEEELSIAEIESFDTEYSQLILLWSTVEPEERAVYHNRMVDSLDELSEQLDTLKKIHGNNDLSAMERKESILRLQKLIAETCKQLERHTPP
jgi:hypothetical protein